MATANPMTVMYEVLTTSGTDLYTAVATRIYPRLPRAFRNEAKAIQFDIDGGDHETGTPIMRPRFVFKCYGGSLDSDDSWDLWKNLYDRLHELADVTVTEGYLMFAREAIPGQLLSDPELPDWRYVVTTYETEMRALT